ncbi:hypothetical protein MCUN1_002485 [Malassezia cuniculi]|uniref:Uncharacterized protein n=1 Tax=Malassezia cuniculi TaxID=948313 RepID=A0AAF0EVU0_9BASI|nr:hypothetical protein MCUN1_002485 [Malassezia cuniculi]
MRGEASDHAIDFIVKYINGPKVDQDTVEEVVLAFAVLVRDDRKKGIKPLIDILERLCELVPSFSREVKHNISVMIAETTQNNEEDSEEVKQKLKEIVEAHPEAYKLHEDDEVMEELRQIMAELYTPKITREDDDASFDDSEYIED